MWTKSRLFHFEGCDARRIGALRWGVAQLHPPMSHGPVTMIRTASGSMNGDITATIWPLWDGIFQTG